VVRSIPREPPTRVAQPAPKRHLGQPAPSRSGSSSRQKTPREPPPSSSASSLATPGCPRPHSHDGFDETVYGLAGVTTFTVDGHTRDIGPGDAVCIRRGQVHHFVNHDSADAKFLSVATPGIFGPAYFQEMRDVLAAAMAGPPDVAALVQVMRRHGLTPA
jgi:mannose-6-phosphate isomerase-like protein (cupin superfamily)